jgi:superfamily II DNA or RNA helicase
MAGWPRGKAFTVIRTEGSDPAANSCTRPVAARAACTDQRATTHRDGSDGEGLDGVRWAASLETSTGLTLRPYQRAGLAAIEAAFIRGVLRQCLVWPTGAGKTILFALLIALRGGRALILVHRDELVQQTLDKLHLIAPHVRVGVVKAERNELGADVLIASVQTLTREARLQQVDATFTTIVVDEAHHAVAPTYLRVIGHTMGSGAPLLLGVTATPDRLDRIGLQHVFQEIVHKIGLLELMQQGYLVDIRALRIALRIDFDRITRRGGDLAEGELADALTDADAPEHIAAAYAEHARDRTGVVFVPTVALAHETAEAINAEGITCEALDGTTPIDERRAILRRLSDGTTQVVANCMVLTEGFDEPRVDCIVVGRPTASRPLYQQQIGRGLRPYPGKSDCLVIDLVGNSERHELVTAASLFGLDPKGVALQGVLEAKRAAQRREQERTAAIDGDLLVHEVDLFDRRDLIWTPSGPAHVLSLGEDGYVGIEPLRDGTWCVMVHDGKDWGARLERTHHGLSLNYAMGVAEDMARRHVPRVLRDPTARWRTQTPSDGQLAFFAKRGWDPPNTKGEASERMSHWFAAQAWRRARR